MGTTTIRVPLNTMLADLDETVRQLSTPTVNLLLHDVRQSEDSTYFAWWSGQGGKHTRIGAGGPEAVAKPGGQNSGAVDPRSK